LIEDGSVVKIKEVWERGEVKLKNDLSEVRRVFSQVKVGFFNLLIITSISAMAGTYLTLYYLERGLAIDQIIFFFLGAYGLSVLFNPLVRRYRLSVSISLGFLCYVLMYVSLIIPSVWLSLGMAAFFLSWAVVLLWVPLNRIYYQGSERRANALSSSIYMLFPSVLAIFLPLVGMKIAESLGYKVLFSLGALLFLGGAAYAYHSVKKVIEVGGTKEVSEEAPFFEAWKNFKGIKTLTIFEGALQSFSIAMIPLLSLRFLQEKSEIGWFFSYLGVLSFIVALALAIWSDHQKKRKVLLYIMFFFMGLLLVGLTFVENAEQWVLVIGLYSLVNSLSLPLRLAISLDVKEPSLGFWKIREWFLNVGRIIFLAMGAVFLYRGSFWAVFAAYTLLCLAYPLLVKKKLIMIN
jgi:MFS family permease